MHNTGQSFYRYTETRKTKTEERKVAKISVLANERGRGRADLTTAKSIIFFSYFCSLIRIKEEKKTF
jgi:hypothetical protein